MLEVRPSARRTHLAVCLGLLAGLAGAGLFSAAESSRPGLQGRAGASLPFDVRCFDERGASFPLASLLDRPALLALVYYRCEHICPQVLVALGRLAGTLDLVPGRDYRLITLSFDPEDTPAAAASAKRNYILPLLPDFPESAWTFATADAADIMALTRALGFSYQSQGHGFVHPSVLVVLAPGGRIAGYVNVEKFSYGVAYPVTFSPVTMRQALLDAAAGRMVPASTAPLLFCFPGEPSGRAGYFRLTTVLGLATLACLAALLGILIVLGQKSKEA